MTQTQASHFSLVFNPLFTSCAIHGASEASIAPSFFGFPLPSTTLPLLHIQAQPSNIPDHVAYYVYLILCPYAGGFICDNNLADYITVKTDFVNPLKPELNPICYMLALLGAHHFLHISRIRVKLLTFRRLMSYIYGAPILDVSRSHTTTQHSR